MEILVGFFVGSLLTYAVISHKKQFPNDEKIISKMLRPHYDVEMGRLETQEEVNLRVQARLAKVKSARATIEAFENFGDDSLPLRDPRLNV